MAVISFVCSIGNVPLAAVLWNGGDLVRRRDRLHLRRSDHLPILNIYRKYYGLRMALFITVTFYAAIAAAGLLVDLVFHAVGLAPTVRNAKMLEASVHWNYTTALNITFLSLAALLCYRFIRTGGVPMLRAMDEPPGEHG